MTKKGFIKLGVILASVLALVGVVAYTHSVKSVGASTGNLDSNGHNEWVREELRRGQCAPVSDECGVERGTQKVLYKETCTKVDGRGGDQCQRYVCNGDWSIGLYCHHGNWIPNIREALVDESCRVQEPKQCGTERWCVPSEESESGFEAKAIPTNEESPEGSKPWETGMDKWCEVPTEPEVPAEPTPAVQRHDEPGAFVCQDLSVLALPLNVLVERKGDQAVMTWIPTGGNLANIYLLDKDGKEIGAKADVPNDGNETIDHLNPSADYSFELEQHVGCGGGQRARVGVIDSYLPMIFHSSYWKWSN